MNSKAIINAMDKTPPAVTSAANNLSFPMARIAGECAVTYGFSCMALCVLGRGDYIQVHKFTAPPPKAGGTAPPDFGASERRDRVGATWRFV
jgi:hypothetical protein